MSNRKYRPKLNQKDKPSDGAQDKPAENSGKVEEVRRPIKDNWTDIDGLLSRIKARAAAEKASGANTGDPASAKAEAPSTSSGQAARATSADPRVKQAQSAHAKAAEAAKIVTEEAKAEEARRAEKGSASAGSGQADPVSAPDSTPDSKDAAAETGSDPLRGSKSDPLDDWLAGLSDEEVKRWREYGETMLGCLEYHVHGVSSGEGPLSDDEVKGYLANGVRFLHQTVTMTSHVLDTVDVKTLRRIVASDTDSTSLRKALKVLGRDADEVLGPETGGGKQEAGTSSDWRKRPRGRRHPLLQLVALACSSVRLINQITRDTNPHAHNRPTLEERQDAQFERVLGGIATDVERIAKR